ncbi:hypothetical protein [Halocynthiibacter namhaensis]|uniref:hypothetical protein n=1 Tax=Halocynthiibacter namhaensis TaxID=1290553 RepID=UPI0005790399|nr:hypothetical protein [Halocynthiibacter namhaensis]
MTKYTKPNLPIGSEITDGSSCSRIVAVLDGMAVLRPKGADANDHQDFFLPVSDIEGKMNDADFEITLLPWRQQHQRFRSVVKRQHGMASP